MPLSLTNSMEAKFFRLIFTMKSENRATVTHFFVVLALYFSKPHMKFNNWMFAYIFT